jgi:dTDP-4-dehydrorhamnose reductase
MRVLITGSHGQVAQTVAQVAASRTEVSALAMGRPALDLCSVPSIRRALFEISPDIVINTAAYTDVDNAEREPQRAFELNADGAAAIAAEAAQAKVPIIHLSTDYVFDGTKPAPYTEEDEPAPATVYGLSKLQGEAAVASANPMHVILRTAWIYSPDGRNFVTKMIQQARESPVIEVVDDQTGSPTYARHLADVILSIAAQVVSGPAASAWGVYHAAGSGGVSWCGLAREVFAVSSKLGGPAAQIVPINSSQYPTVAARPQNAQLDCDKLGRTFGLQLPEWRDGVNDCLQRLLTGAPDRTRLG